MAKWSLHTHTCAHAYKHVHTSKGIGVRACYMQNSPHSNIKISDKYKWRQKLWKVPKSFLFAHWSDLSFPVCLLAASIVPPLFFRGVHVHVADISDIVQLWVLFFPLAWIKRIQCVSVCGRRVFSLARTQYKKERKGERGSDCFPFLITCMFIITGFRL